MAQVTEATVTTLATALEKLAARMEAVERKRPAEDALPAPPAKKLRTEGSEPVAVPEEKVLFYVSVPRDLSGLPLGLWCEMRRDDFATFNQTLQAHTELPKHIFFIE